MNFERGDIIWVWIPESWKSFDPHESRPALVLSVLPNKTLGIAMMGSQVAKEKLLVGDVVIPAQEGTGLSREGKVKCYAVAAISRRLVKSKVGRLPERFWPAIEAGLNIRYPKSMI